MDAQTHAFMVYAVSVLSVSLIALVHLRVHRMRFMADTSVPWVAASAGLAASYVFVNLLPKLAAGHEVLAASQSSGWLRYIVGHSYVLALVGFITFYAAHLVRKRAMPQFPADRISFGEAPNAVKLMAIAFPAYNFLIGDLLGAYAMQQGAPAILFAVVIAIHFIGLDLLFRMAFNRLYDGTLRGLNIAALPAFEIISDALLVLGDLNPLVSLAVAVNLLSAITGSASGGMSIALETLGPTYVQLAVAQNISLEAMHRVTSIASGTLDVLPHNGAVITVLSICKLDHEEAYGDIAMAAIAGPMLALVIVVLLAGFFGGF